MSRCTNKLTILMLLLAALFTFGWVGQVFAQLTDVELDGNIREVPATTGEDWDTSLTAPNVAGINKLSIPSAAILRTGAVLDPDGQTLFTLGSKDIEDIPDWHWTDQSAPDKDEIQHGYAALYPGGKFYAGADREATNGDAFIGVWVIQDPAFAKNADGSFSGHHTLGDMLFLSDFTGGGGTASPRVYFWNTGAAAFGGVKVSATIESVTVSGAAFGIVNTLRLKPNYWTYAGKFNPKDSIPANGFFEGGIDFGALGLSFPCATSIVIETRSSSSITAELKDFLLHDFRVVPSASVNSPAVCPGNSAQICATVVGGIPPLTYTWSGPAGFVDPGNVACFNASINGTYQVIVAGSNGCVDTATGSLTVYPNPTCSISNDGPFCPASSNQHCGPAGMASYSWSISGDGTISGSSTSQCVTVQAASHCGSYTLNLTITDANGCSNTCSKTINLVDTTPPVLSNVPTGGDLGCNPTRPSCAQNVTATDNCAGTVPVTCTPGAITGDCNKSQTFRYSATDNCGNESHQDVTYTWKEDLTPPVLSNVPAGGDLGCNPTLPSCDASVTALDNCDGAVNVNCAAGAITGDCNKSQTFTYSAVDACGNRSSQSVTYTWKEDLAAPSLSCPGNYTFSCTSGSVTAPTTAADNCDGNVSATCTRSDGQALSAPYPIGTTTVSCGAVDACGNRASCSFTVTVNSCFAGCTPGFFKRWTNVWDQPNDAVSSCVASAIAAAGSNPPWFGDGTTNSLFRGTFGVTSAQMSAVGLSPSLTLIQAINLGGGGFQKLARHGVAGLLSSCAVNYTYSSSQVLTMVHNAIINRQAEPTAQQLADANNLPEQTCPTGGLVVLGAPEKTGEGLVVAEKPVGSALPTEFALRGSYPNPFNASTQINFALPQAGTVRLVIYNILGQPVRNLVDGEMPAGERSVSWNGTDNSGRGLSSGVYFYKIMFGGQVKVGRMNLLK